MRGILQRSTKIGKKFMVTLFQNDTFRVVHFGAAGMSDYTIHGDKARKAAYLKRHKPRENWSDPFTAGFWAKHLLWNKPTISASLSDVKRRFGIKINKKI